MKRIWIAITAGFLLMAGIDALAKPMTIGDEATRGLKEVRHWLYKIESNAEEIQRSANAPTVDRELQKQRLGELADQINRAGKALQPAASESPALAEWQQQAIAKTADLLKKEGDQAQREIAYAREQPMRLGSPAFRAMAANSLATAEEMSRELSQWLKLEKADDQAVKLRQDLVNQ
jgi:hypothetical protein